MQIEEYIWTIYGIGRSLRDRRGILFSLGALEEIALPIEGWPWLFMGTGLRSSWLVFGSVLAMGRGRHGGGMVRPSRGLLRVVALCCAPLRSGVLWERARSGGSLNCKFYQTNPTRKLHNCFRDSQL